MDSEKGFLEGLDQFEEIKEDWVDEVNEELFTGKVNCAMANQMIGEWEEMPVSEGQSTKQWQVLPKPNIPIISSFACQNYKSLDRFVPHDPKRKPVKKEKTEAEKTESSTSTG